MYNNVTGLATASGAATSLALTGPTSTAYLLMAGFTLVGAGLALKRTLPRVTSSR